MSARGAAFALALGLAALPACRGETAPAPSVGTLERERVELVAEANEPIVEIAAREGDRLSAGQRVLRLDDTRVRADVEQAEAQRAQAAARLAELVRGPRAERIAEARARLAGAESAVANARRDVERNRALARQDYASASRMDALQLVLEEAEARRDEARASLQALVDGTTAEELDQARAALAAAEAAVANLRVRLERLDVRAPRSATLDALPFERGERPPAGAVVAVLLAGDTPYARVYVPEPIRVRVRPGTAATVHLDGVDRPFRGRVRTVSSDATFTPFFALTERDRSRLSYVAEVDLVEPEAAALPTGVPAQVFFELDGPAPEAAP